MFVVNVSRLEQVVEKKVEEVKSEVKMIDAGKEAAIEAEVKAARERAIIPLEIRMKQFRDMLAEKEVTNVKFVRWCIWLILNTISNTILYL